MMTVGRTVLGMAVMNLDLLVFRVYLAVVATVGILASRKEKETDDYFLAGRNLTWWIIGGSMIAANISTHHFIGMSGSAYEIGLAIASFEWIAAIALILYGKFFLPYYLKSRITTMPEFLERRFSDKVRLVYAIISLIGYIVIELAVVLYTGSLAIHRSSVCRLAYGLVILCVIGGGYTIYGGFKSVAYTDIIQVTVLILGGLTVTLLGLHKVGVALAGVRGLGHGRLADDPGRVAGEVPHGQGLERSRAALDRRVLRRHVAGQHLLLGLQSVHHPADPGGQDRLARADGRGLRRFPETAGAGAGRAAGDHRLPALQSRQPACSASDVRAGRRATWPFRRW